MILSNKTILFLLCFFCSISLFLHIFKVNGLCLNEDEAAQGYNTYSVLKTGKDEYGKLPIRFLSFGENKLPLTGLLSLPFIAIFGLDTQTVRIPTHIVGVLFPLLFYFATFALTKNRWTSLYSSFFASVNIWLQTTSRHQHETVILSAIVLIYITLLFWNRLLQKKHVVILSALSFLGLYTYHSAKIIMPALAAATIIYTYFANTGTRATRVKSAFIAGIILVVGVLLFLSTELIVPNNRIGNLSYLTNPVITYEIEEGRRVGGSRLFFNKPVYVTYKLVSRSAAYLLPDFLLFKSDTNPRYGASYLPLLTYAEYFLFVCGIIFTLWKIVKKQEKSSLIFLYFFTIISIIPAALALPVYSSTRSYLLLIPIIIFASLGTNYIFSIMKKQNKYFVAVPIIILTLHIFITQSNWKIYFNKYLSDPATKIAWQCGMKEVAIEAWNSYAQYDRIFIDNRLGQAYIFLLFYGGPYQPQNYQKVAKRMPYNKYGFWEQDEFDKFVFVKNKPLQNSSSKEIFIERND